LNAINIVTNLWHYGNER